MVIVALRLWWAEAKMVVTVLIVVMLMVVPVLFRLKCVVYFSVFRKDFNDRCPLSRELKEVRKFARQKVKYKSHVLELCFACIRNRKEASVLGVERI